MPKNKIWGLDVLRILAAFGVMCYHYFFIGVIQGFYSWDVFCPVAYWGEMGVDIFFLISGFVILMSTTGRSKKAFIKSRMKRIYPPLVICSIFTLICDSIMPDMKIKDLIMAWISSITFAGAFGGNVLSSIYWTLMVEIKFYILVTLFLNTEALNKHINILMFIWLGISFLNTYWLKNTYLEILLNTKYAGHFCLGMICYLAYTGKRQNGMVLNIAISVWLIYLNIIGYTGWIRSIYDLGYSDIEIFLGLILLLSLFAWSILQVDINDKLKKHIK